MVAAHAVLPAQVRRHPLHRVGEHLDVRHLVGDVDLALRVGAHVHRHDLVHVVPDAEVQVRVQVPVRRLQVAQQQLLALHLADVAPHGQVLHEHLEVVVVLDGIREHAHLRRRERLVAEQEPLHVVQEGDLVRRRHFAVAHQVLAQFVVVPLLLARGAAERQGVVLRVVV